jgi:phosphoserine phosphatase
MSIYREDPPSGCRYLLSLFTGVPIETLHQWLELFWRHKAHRQWIPQVLETLFHLADKDYSIWIVSGTPTDFLLPLQRFLPIEKVVGMDFELTGGGQITGRHSGISCAGEGKAEKLLHLADSRRICFCCGNGTLDGSMMELSELAWSVYPNPQFAAFCQAKGWHILPRPADFLEEPKFIIEENKKNKD